MKKTIIMAGIALVAIMACKKEVNNVGPVVKVATTTQNFLEEDWLDLEFYKEDEEDDELLLDELESELLRFNNEYELGSCNVDKAIFLFEAGINMLNQDAQEGWTAEEVDTAYFELSMTDEMVDELDLRAAIAELHGMIASTITSTTKHIATDIKINTVDVEGETITFAAYSVYATGTNGTPWVLDNSLTLASIPHNIKAGEWEKCGGFSGYSDAAVYVCGREAYKTLRKINGHAVRYNPCFLFMNVMIYSSLSNQSAYPMSHDRLLGQSSAAVSAHQGYVLKSYCVNGNDLDIYAAQIHADVTALLGKDRGVINLDMTFSNDVNNYTKWKYKEVRTGRRLFHGSCPRTLNASLTYL